MASPEGIDRGASKEKVYNSARLSAAPLTRMFEDAQTTGGWRDKGFWPVLNEHDQTTQANLQASIMHHLLVQKREHPLPDVDVLDKKEFDLGLDRKQFCTNADELQKFKQKNPGWGMPYAMQGISDEEYLILKSWLADGAVMAHPEGLSDDIAAQLADWEAFLNDDSLKQQLVSRYLYEHWFLANLYFRDSGEGVYFKLVRSATAPGQPVEVIATRRPYDDPGVERVYYRFRLDHSTVVDKTHMPYALDADRMAWIRAMLLEPEYTVDALPSYEPDVAANPFVAYEVLPIEGRWEFLRSEAQFTVMNFIKGPVCRGQVALSVIQDNFWVFFADSKEMQTVEASRFLSKQKFNLATPVEAGSKVAPFHVWRRYSDRQKEYLAAKVAFIDQNFEGEIPIDTNLIWDGDGANQNAALTVFRHFDSASVVKGLVGPMPKTAWIIDYPVLERIHYLLVAGFDVYGNLGHQLTTRLYMDFLRLESEFNFLMLLPPEVRKAEAQYWYSGASDRQKKYLYGGAVDFEYPSAIRYRTAEPKLELYGMIQERLQPVLNHEFDLTEETVPLQQYSSLAKLAGLKGSMLSMVPELVILNVQDETGADHYYTVLRNTARNNITSLFMESKNRLPDDDTLAVIPGFIGSYPGAYWKVSEAGLSEMVERVAALEDEGSYRVFMADYGVRRTNKDFWAHSDKVIQAHYEADPVANGLLDYNRLENR